MILDGDYDPDTSSPRSCSVEARVRQGVEGSRHHGVSWNVFPAWTRPRTGCCPTRPRPNLAAVAQISGVRDPDHAALARRCASHCNPRGCRRPSFNGSRRQPSSHSLPRDPAVGGRAPWAGHGGGAWPIGHLHNRPMRSRWRSRALSCAFHPISPRSVSNNRREDGTREANRGRDKSLLFHDLLHVPAVGSEGGFEGVVYGIPRQIGGYETDRPGGSRARR